MHRSLRWFMLAALALAACGAPGATEPPTIVVAAASQPATQAGPPTVAAPTQPVSDLATPEVTALAATRAAPGAEAATQAPTSALPTEAPTAFVISDEFTPSDPETVNLGAGKPQLVEFFAFW